MSGNDINDEHSQNTPHKFLVLEIFHLEMSGKDSNL